MTHVNMRHADGQLSSCGGETPLYLAAWHGDEETVRRITASAVQRNRFLEVADASHGWTPLFAACIAGHLQVVKILLNAGAALGKCDRRGWTEKEYTVYHGHMHIAELLCLHALEDSPNKSSLFSKQGRVVPGNELLCSAQGQPTIATRLEVEHMQSNAYDLNKGKSQVFVSLGPSNTRSSLEALNLLAKADPLNSNASKEDHLTLRIIAPAIESPTEYDLEHPAIDNVINRPLHFTTDDPENFFLEFKIYRSTRERRGSASSIGSGVALLKALRQGCAPNRESLVRDHTIPILETGSMNYIGTLTFHFLVISPFSRPSKPPRKSIGFWKGDGSTQVVGHRGFGANSTARTHLQIGENTIQSFLVAANLGASCVEFDVQLTKDYRSVIFHDFLVMQTGGDVPLHALTFDQFMQFSRLQTPRSDSLGSGKAQQQNAQRKGARSHSFSFKDSDDPRLVQTSERMHFTEEGKLGSIKGNLRGFSISEPASTLEELLCELPESLPFNLEIKYPMLWEAEDREMELYAMEINFYVNTILDTIYNYCGKRNITLSSFSPEICILLACKQSSFPILFINKAGSVPAGDIRAGSLKGAIEFAKAWSLAGIVMLSDPFVMCPRLLTYAKDCGLVVGSYGNLNDDPEFAKVSTSSPTPVEE